MANRILTAEGWQARVRNRLGISATYLTDADIAQPDIIDVAEANIIEQVPDWAELTEDSRTWLEAATVCGCAVLLCSSMDARLPAREQGPHFTQSVAANWSQKQRQMETERDSYILKIVSPWSVVDVPHFGLTR